MFCKKCGSAMYYSNVYKIRAHTCYICGNVDYPDYPKRSAPANVCDLCGEEYERKNMLQGLCETCRKLSGKNFNKAMRKFKNNIIMFPEAVAYSDIKLEAQLR